MRDEPDQDPATGSHAHPPLPGRWLGLLDRATGQLFRWVNILGVCMILAMMALTTVDVSLRYCCSRPITGTVELVEFMLVIAVFFGLAHTQRRGGNIAADIIDTLLPQRIIRMLDVFTGALALLLCIAMAWSTFGEAMDPNAQWDTTDMLEVPIWPFKLLAAIGLGLLSIEMLVHLMRRVFEVIARPDRAA
ncbi:MAG: TRAP transporter small permease [Burkholderiaceae bacterium]